MMILITNQGLTSSRGIALGLRSQFGEACSLYLFIKQTEYLKSKISIPKSKIDKSIISQYRRLKLTISGSTYILIGLSSSGFNVPD
jgi:hypothetical protein